LETASTYPSLSKSDARSSRRNSNDD
jgi:hypothetical protein